MISVWTYLGGVFALFFFGPFVLRLFVWLWCRLTLPIERRLLVWLQDRSTARTLGVDIDVIRFRRKIDFPDQRPA